MSAGTASRAPAQPADSSADAATSEDEQPSLGRLAAPLPLYVCGRRGPCSTVAAASVPSGPPLPTATRRPRALSWLGLTPANVKRVVDPEVAPGTRTPPAVITVKPPLR